MLGWNLSHAFSEGREGGRAKGGRARAVRLPALSSTCAHGTCGRFEESDQIILVGGYKIALGILRVPSGSWVITGVGGCSGQMLYVRACREARYKTTDIGARNAWLSFASPLFSK
jgi:hypothetical protein